MVDNQHDISQNTHADARRDRRSNAATGASAAGARAFGSQAIAFYFRAPAKAFFRTRVDYLAFARAVNPRVQAQEGWSLRMTAPGLLNHAVRTYGWGFLPKHVLPPLIANIGVGAVLYTSYLQVLSTLHKPSSQSLKKIFPPPPIHCTFLAGFSAGAIQSVVAAPLDAVSVRFRTNEILNGRYKTMWQYGRKKLQEIGPRGVFAGWGLSFVKDSLGYAAFFASFEYVKAQAYYKFVAYYYGESWDQTSTRFLRPRLDKTGSVDVLRPHYCIEPFFLGLAGITAALSQQSIQHPLDLIQGVHYRSIGFLDKQAKIERPKSAMLRAYLSAYRKTYQQCLVQARRSNGWRRWLYKGFLWNSVKQVPASSLALVIFELVRRRYSDEAEAVRIKHEGFDILL